MKYFTYTWFGKMFKDPDFRQDYKTATSNYALTSTNVKHTNAICDNLLLRFEKLRLETGKNGESTNGTYSSVGGGWEGEVSHLKGWIKTRVEWMDAQFLPRLRSSRR